MHASMWSLRLPRCQPYVQPHGRGPAVPCCVIQRQRVLDQFHGCRGASPASEAASGQLQQAPEDPPSSTHTGRSLVLRSNSFMDLLEAEAAVDGGSLSETSTASSSSSSTATDQAPSGSKSRGFQPGARDQQRRVRTHEASAACPCGSGQPYQVCCRPYHVGTARLTTAVDCIKARQAALFLGLEPFLMASTHPDSSGWLGGVRDFLSKKVRRFITLHRTLGLRPLGYVHAPHDHPPGSWAVICVLEATKGQYKGDTQVVAYVCCKDTQTAATTSGTSNSSSSTESSQQQQPQWQFLKGLNVDQLSPQQEALAVELALEVAPELLGDPGDVAGAGLERRGRAFTLQRPAFAGNTAGPWVLDLLPQQPAPGWQYSGTVFSLEDAAAAAGADRR